MILPIPFNQTAWKSQLEQSDNESYKKTQDISVTGGDSTRQQRLILKSPNGTLWSITVDNAGVLSATAI